MSTILRMVGGPMDGWEMVVTVTAAAMALDGMWFSIPDISGDLVRHHYVLSSQRRDGGWDVIEYLYDFEVEQ